MYPFRRRAGPAAKSIRVDIFAHREGRAVAHPNDGELISFINICFCAYGLITPEHGFIRGIHILRPVAGELDRLRGHSLNKGLCVGVRLAVVARLEEGGGEIMGSAAIIGRAVPRE